ADLGSFGHTIAALAETGARIQSTAHPIARDMALKVAESRAGDSADVQPVASFWAVLDPVATTTAAGCVDSAVGVAPNVAAVEAKKAPRGKSPPRRCHIPPASLGPHRHIEGSPPGCPRRHGWARRTHHA